MPSHKEPNRRPLPENRKCRPSQGDGALRKTSDLSRCNEVYRLEEHFSLEQVLADPSAVLQQIITGYPFGESYYPRQEPMERLIGQFVRAARFLATRNNRKTIGYGTAGGWKHSAEQWHRENGGVGDPYVIEHMLVAAALALGFGIKFYRGRSVGITVGRSLKPATEPACRPVTRRLRRRRWR